MPLIIDHEQRRSELAIIAANLIGRDGLKAATIRAVAAEAGFSTKVVTHYFADKEELMFRVYYDAAMRSERRLDEILANDPHDLQGFLEAFLPLSDDTLRDWRIFLASWDMSFSEGVLLERQLYWMDHARGRIKKVLQARQAAGLSVNADPKEAPRLLMIVMGIATQAVFGEAMWSAPNQRRMIADELRR